jgi:hypothetical protein
VARQTGTRDADGNYIAAEETIIGRMSADIQLSLKVRTLISEDGTGVSDTALWIMYCVPPAAILAGDRVYDGARVFAVDASSDWGSHTECVMREV